MTANLARKPATPSTGGDRTRPAERVDPIRIAVWGRDKVPSGIVFPARLADLKRSGGELAAGVRR